MMSEFRRLLEREAERIPPPRFTTQDIIRKRGRRERRGRVAAAVTALILFGGVLGWLAWGLLGSEREPVPASRPPGQVEAPPEEATVTFTGEECRASGRDTFPSRGLGSFNVRNDSAVRVFVGVVEVPAGDTLEEVAARFPRIEGGIHPRAPEELVGFQRVDPGAEVRLEVLFPRPGSYGTVCTPGDGGPTVSGTTLSAEP